jgi:hypothetical protein
MAQIAPMSRPYVADATSCGRVGLVGELKPNEIWLNKYGSIATRKSIIVLSERVLPVSTGRTDMVSV